MLEADELFACAFLSTVVKSPESKAPAYMAVELKRLYGEKKVIEALKLLTEHELIIDPTAAGNDPEWLIATEKGKNFHEKFKLLMGET